MSEELQELGLESIKLLKDFSEKGLEFVEEQAPQVCEQLVNRVLYQSGYCFIVAVIICIFSITFASKWKKEFNAIVAREERTFDDATPSAIMFVCLYAISLVSFLIGSSMFYNFISVYVAPKAFLFDYFSNLIKHV